MQRNQPYRSFSQTVLPKQIVGQGDLTAITFPDGSIQLYFVPAIGENCLSCTCDIRKLHNNIIPCPFHTEVWFVRSITHPQQYTNSSVPPTYFNTQLPNTLGECPPYSPFNNYMNNNPPAYREYIQKFHNDQWTSTSDIHYFYPSLRPAKYLQYCTETQTDRPLQSVLRNGRCPCASSSGLNAQKIECDPNVPLKSTYSCMSVDSETSESEPKRNRKSMESKKKLLKDKKTSKRDHICKCGVKIHHTSDKSVTTYVDKTGNLVNNGRKTQAKLSGSSVKFNCSSQCSCDSGSCTCSTSEAER